MSSQEDINPDSPSGSNSKDAMFEPKPTPKIIRVLTVLAYVLSVSMVAILLSIYYIFVWDGRPQMTARKNVSYKFLENGNSNNDLTSHTENFSTSNEIKYVTSTDGLRMENGTKDYDEEDLNATIPGSTTTQDNEDMIGSELQQQITAMEAEEHIIPSTTPTTTEESATWPDDYETLNEFKKSSTFIKKLIMDKKYQTY